MKKRHVEIRIVIVRRLKKIRGLGEAPTKRESEQNQNVLFHNLFTWILSESCQMADPVAAVAAGVVSLPSCAVDSPDNSPDRSPDQNECGPRFSRATYATRDLSSSLRDTSE